MPRMEAPASGVTVRMYRQNGLGDCFLLAFRAGSNAGPGPCPSDEEPPPDAGAGVEPRYMLIDCGVFTGTSGGAARMEKIAEDIVESTGGRVHVLVGTHEHYDHLSGFGFSKSSQTFEEELAVDEVWVAWTEDDSHPLAKKLKDEIALALAGLRAASARLAAPDERRAAGIDEVLGFFGPGAGTDELGELAATTTKSQFDFVKSTWGAPLYRRPGEAPLTVPGVENVRIYVLGPPEDEGLLTKSDPSTSDSEVYEDDEAPLTPATAFHAAAAGVAMGRPRAGERLDAVERMVRSLEDRSQPFAQEHRLDLEELRTFAEEPRRRPPVELRPQVDFFRANYGFNNRSNHGEAWRRIDDAWLRSAERLALQLDNHVNNTSLALAIELVGTGNVLLFPGDAQVGNWLSWRSVEFDTGGETVTGEELLTRTVFYKVGHHASHNATLREHGLELMESPDLVAMIPVHEEQAKKKKWKMPFEPLYDRLLEKTRGRVIRADKNFSTQKPDALTEAEWERFKDRRSTDGPPDRLWHQYRIPE